jgi:K+-transporting ATPase KdpF subunit
LNPFLFIYSLLNKPITPLPYPLTGQQVFLLFFYTPPSAFFSFFAPRALRCPSSHIGKNSLFLQERNMSFGVIAGAVLVLLLLAYLIYALLRAEAF